MTSQSARMPHKVQCALYQCAAPSNLSLAKTATAALPLYVGSSSGDFTPLHADYRGDCLLFTDADTTYGALMALLQARLNRYMILHGASAQRASPDAATTSAESAGADWPWCQRCHSDGRTGCASCTSPPPPLPPLSSTHTEAASSGSSGSSSALAPSLFVRHVHKLEEGASRAKGVDLRKKCVTARAPPPRQTPRYAVYFCLLLLPKDSTLRTILERTDVNSSPDKQQTPVDKNVHPEDISNHCRFLHLKAAGHVVRAGLSTVNDTVAALVQTLAARRQLEVTRLVADNELHRPALFPCEPASTVARALPYARVVVNTKTSVGAAVDAPALPPPPLPPRWRYGDVASLTHSAPSSLALPASPFPHHEAQIPTPVDQAVQYYGPYAGHLGSGGEGGDNGTIISYSSFSTLHDDAGMYDDGNFAPLSGEVEDARISLGTLEHFSDLSLTPSSALSSTSSLDSPPRRGHENGFRTEYNGGRDHPHLIDPEEAFIVSLDPSAVNSQAMSDQRDGVESEEERSAPFVARSASLGDASTSFDAAPEALAEEEKTGGSEGGGSFSDDQDVALTVPLAGRRQASSDALWNLNNDFVFEVEDDSMSPSRGRDAHASSAEPSTPSARPSVRPDPHSPPDDAVFSGVGTRAGGDSPATVRRKPRLVVVSSPASYRLSASGSSGHPTPARLPHARHAGTGLSPPRWHFAQSDTQTGLFSVPTKDFGLAATTRGSHAASTATRPASSAEEVVAIVGDPTVVFSQPLGTAPSSQAAAKEGDERHGGTNVRTKRFASSPSPASRASPQRRIEAAPSSVAVHKTPGTGAEPREASTLYANVLEETPTDIPLHQDGAHTREARAFSQTRTRAITPPTVRQPRRRSPIRLSPGDLVFSTDSSPHAALSPFAAHTPQRAVAYVASQNVLSPIRGGASTAQHSRTDAVHHGSAHPSLSPAHRASPIARFSYAAPERLESSTMMITQQAIPEYTLPDDYESSSESSRSSRSRSSAGSDHDVKVSANSDDEDDDAVLGGEGDDDDYSDDSEYVFTGL